jgi:hypothetical protein
MVINVFYIWFFFLLTVKAQDCSIVVDLWKFWGRKTTVSETSKNGCCSMDGVFCSKGSVTAIYWSSQSLTGAIPHYVGNLAKLRVL